MTNGGLVYVYAILAQPVLATLVGIDARPVRWVQTRDLAAAVSDVPQADFEEAPLNAHIRDLTWLAPRAEAHQAINAALSDLADACLPLSFGTVFRTDARVEQLLVAQGGQLRQRLARVRGKAEWVVALHRTGAPAVATTPAVQALRAQIEASTPGRAHLLRRRLAEVERDEARRLDSEAVSSVLDALRGVADDTFQEPLPAESVERPLVRASVLVERAGEERFVQVMDALRQRWPEPTYRLLLTGPWPAYRFGGLATSDEAAGVVG